jgi:hypothetical protein
MITSDRGTQFTSNIWSQLSEMLHVSHCQTTAYHPELNGAVELSQGCASLTCCRCDLVQGATFCTPRPPLMQLLNNFKKLWMLQLFPCPGTIPASSCQPSCQTSCCTPPSSGCAAAAYVPPLHRPYDSPYSVLRRGPRSFTIRVRSRDEIVSVSHLKACTEADATPGSPPCHGRPPGKRPSGHAATKRVSFAHPLVSPPSFPQAPPSDGPGTVFPVADQFFARPGPAAPSQPPQTRYPSRQRAQPQGLDL